ncbi:hypothetical protein C1H46_034922 [Malus baccata]|uniref:Uncharacterized protein n=1 Tax=Malus baccata TaxID=106549 RepID=A0A540KZ48_MALBA|nr:hypothetical protein C1H46_034922 [Malus baccata]
MSEINLITDLDAIPLRALNTLSTNPSATTLAGTNTGGVCIAIATHLAIVTGHIKLARKNPRVPNLSI